MEYDIRFVNARIKGIVDNEMSSKYLAWGMGATYVLYIRFAKLYLQNNELHPLFERLRVDYESAKNLCIFHVDSSVLFS